MRLFTAALAASVTVACSSNPASQSSQLGPGYPGRGLDYQPMPAGSIMHCFYGEDDPTTPAATIEHVLEIFSGASSVHIRLTLDPRFVDNTYGANAIGWDRGHTYKQLDGSDHAQLVLYDGNGDVALDFAMDYITKQVTEGVWGGDGEVNHGDDSYVLAVDTSLSQNFNARGYASFTEDSPATDDNYTPNPAAPGWDYRVVYEVWVDLDAFGTAGFGSADVEYIHASPAKSKENTIIVDPDPCPPDWDPEGDCNDPDGCDHDPGDSCPGGEGCPGDCTGQDECPDGCQSDDDCASGEFCAEDGSCLPYVG